MPVDNGDLPAFPGDGDPYFECEDGKFRLRSEFDMPPEPAHGLTKREEFAARALEGLLANPRVWEEVERMEVADLAARHADCLLSALAKQKTTQNLPLSEEGQSLPTGKAIWSSAVPTEDGLYWGMSRSDNSEETPTPLLRNSFVGSFPWIGIHDGGLMSDQEVVEKYRFGPKIPSPDACQLFMERGVTEMLEKKHLKHLIISYANSFFEAGRATANRNASRLVNCHNEQARLFEQIEELLGVQKNEAQVTPVSN